MSTPPPAQELPKILDRLKDVRSDAAELRNFTITFLSLLLYINIIIASTNAEQILRITPVTLPLLNVPLSIVAFYGFVPWLLVLFHLYLLVQHYLFSQQLFLFKNTLDDPLAVSDDIRKYVRKNLGNLPFLHWMVGKHSFPMRGVLTLTTLIYLLIWPLLTLLWLQMAIMPYHSETLIWVQRFAIILDVFLIGWLWPKTLANDDSSAAWWWRGVGGFWYALVILPRCLLWRVYRIPIAGLWSRVVSLLPLRFYSPLSSVITKTLLVLALPTILVFGLIVVSLPDAWDYFVPLCLLWVICRITVLYVAVVHPASLRLTVKSTLPKSINTSTLPLGLGLFTALFLSLAVATLPDSDGEKFITSDVNSKIIKPDESFWLKVVDVSEEMIPTRMAFTPTAWLHEQHTKKDFKGDEYQEELLKGAKPCGDPDKVVEDNTKKCLMVQPLFPRNLILRDKVLTYDSNDSKFSPELEAKLRASVHEMIKEEDLVKIRGLNLQGRNFDYADFTNSSLPKVDLSHASLKHAVLLKTRLEQADLQAAHFEEANLLQAKLFGAKLGYADLSGAALHLAKLSGADMNNAKLLGANLYQADLSGAKLNNADLSGASLNGTVLLGTRLDNADLSGVWLKIRYTQLGVMPNKAKQHGTLLEINTTLLSEYELMQTIYDYLNVLLLGWQQEYNVKSFVNRVQQPVDSISYMLNNPSGCKNALNKIHCGKLSNVWFGYDTQKKALGDVWSDLACKDTTKGHWLAKAMLIRAGRDFNWFINYLLNAVQAPKSCAWDWLTEKDIQEALSKTWRKSVCEKDKDKTSEHEKGMDKAKTC